MRLISHRGNLSGRSPETENSPDRIDYCVVKGFDVEIDLWVVGNSYILGHDEPQYEVTKRYLDERIDNLWIHCKNESALFRLFYSDYNYFWHQEDDFTITSKRFIWTYPNKQEQYHKNQVILDFEEINQEKLYDYKSKNIFGVCSDNFSFL